MARAFRFGLAIANGPGDDPVADATRAERSGFDVAVVSDHIGQGFSPLPTLVAAAVATNSIRLGTMVLNADVRNPVQLAWDAATIDRLSGGRFELGLGAGHTPQEYGAMGMTQDLPSVRKRRLIESAEIIARLLAGETVTSHGEFFDIVDACIADAPCSVPLLIGGNGASLLGWAGARADIVGLQGLGRTQADGHRHDVRWGADHLERQLDQVRAGAGERFDDIELSALVQIVEVTDDADGAIAKLCERAPSVSPDEVADAPYALIGTEDEIVAKIERCRDRWGISYFVVRDHRAFEPILRRITT